MKVIVRDEEFGYSAFENQYLQIWLCLDIPEEVPEAQEKFGPRQVERRLVDRCSPVVMPYFCDFEWKVGHFGESVSGD